MDDPTKFSVSDLVEYYEKLRDEARKIQPAPQFFIVVSVRMWRYTYMRYLISVWHLPYPLAVWWSNHIPAQCLPDLEKMWDKLILRELNEDRTG